MPEMDGFECSRALIDMMYKFVIPEIPIFGCSANDDQSSIQLCFEVGMSGFISKPVTLSKIDELIKSIPCDDKVLEVED